MTTTRFKWIGLQPPRLLECANELWTVSFTPPYLQGRLRTPRQLENSIAKAETLLNDPRTRTSSRHQRCQTCLDSERRKRYHHFPFMWFKKRKKKTKKKVFQILVTIRIKHAIDKLLQFCLWNKLIHTRANRLLISNLYWMLRREGERRKPGYSREVLPNVESFISSV